MAEQEHDPHATGTNPTKPERMDDFWQSLFDYYAGALVRCGWQPGDPVPKMTGIEMINGLYDACDQKAAKAQRSRQRHDGEATT